MTGTNNSQHADLERRLDDLDFSDQSAVRESLGRDLARRARARKINMNKPYSRARRFDMIRRPAPAFILGIFVTLAVLTLATPYGRAALKSLFRIGDHTYIHEAPAFSDAALDSVMTHLNQSREKGESYFQMSPYGGIGGAVPEGADPFIKELGSISLAAGMVDYPLLIPTYFNERIPANLRFQKALITPDGSSMLYFGIGPLETVLTFIPVGEGQEVGYSESTTTVAEDGTRTMTPVIPDLEEIEVGGRTVVWQVHSEGVRSNLGGWATRFPEREIGKFLWEQDGLSCALNGKFLTKEEGIKIIESLTPTR